MVKTPLPNTNSAKASLKPLIVCKNLKLSLKSQSGAVEVLRGISLDIKKGERLGIVGPSGSGKTTLLMVISGLQKPTSGSVHYEADDITTMNEDELARFRRDHVGIVFQNFHLIPTMTALENVATPREFAGDKDAFKKAEDTLNAVGLGHRLKHYPSQLSGGEQQRVALARALVGQPDVIMADEPTGNLDGETGETVIKLLFDLSKKQGTTLILVTHDTKLAGRCDRQISIADGVLSS